ncbi:aminopeptidase N [Pseudochelatococcus contaminans]|uniref:Aminopeptidase N n=1 Tax=Pseudochelatococcus contaminans TaxID=1538103 RepID=A0A7W5Z4C2_9HYPH|nr:aminopeptidase N [Pseudochelatococcus contaminans]MBB3809833.1 aminopeptidase N [Pseudochelatococcus contaminans]
MSAENASLIRLEDYRPTDYLIDTVALTFRLHPTDTRIVSRLSVRPNPAGQTGAPLVLDGDDLTLVSISLDDAPLAQDAYTVSPSRLVITAPPQRPFTLTLETAVNPTANTKLMGLYRSSGVYCTQCEADGFRRITYFLDRPDVLSVYTARIEADADTPLLLGNGNLVEAGARADGGHFAVWHDPFPKPGYLFAIVGGDLDKVEDVFITASGREVKVAVYVEKGKSERARYALDALQRSMRWDEDVFGREYDLDVFNIVAVSDFNMGAMENKGLNIFNDKYVLASEDTATDGDYANIEAIIAHEYFHNWTGNRITCRDWFQLCLKEGLTVFRDQEFSSDARSRAVKRIADVRVLRASQFPEDAGPLAHPVRPRAYKEINNFYTATVYEKGAELIRVLKTLIGAQSFRRGMDLYFDRHDGTAATIEEFIACFAEASGQDLAAFSRWYEQAGTPRVTARGIYDAGNRTYTLTLTQETPPTPGQPDKHPMVIPVALGLVGADGREIALKTADGAPHDGIVVLDTAEKTITFSQVDSSPTPSLLREFSAPVILDIDLSDDDLLRLFAYDTDPFNQWQSAQTVATRIIRRAVDDIRAGRTPQTPDNLVHALAEFLDARATRDPAFAAQVLALPGESDIAREIGSDIDPDAIHVARKTIRAGLGRALADKLAALYNDLAVTARYRPDAAQAGQRALRNAVLDLLTAGDPTRGGALAQAQFDSADNMTDRIVALATLTHVAGLACENALAAFAARYADNPLVLDKWFSLQAMIAEPETLDRVKALLDHPAFSLSNPNRTRALVGSFAMANPTQFARPDGAGFAFVADIIIRLDPANPQLASRLATAFRTWKTLEPGRRAHAEAALERIAAATPLSPDVSDIVGRMLDRAL